MLSRLHAMGEYWRDDDTPTDLGAQFSRAKDDQDATALTALCVQFGEFASTVAAPATTLVIAVPPGPHRDAHPVPALAAAVAGALSVPLGPVVERRNETARLRDTPIDRRQHVVDAAGYRVMGDVLSQRVLLVDDVVLTGTTLRHLAGLLVEAGAADVCGLVVCRTRRRGDGS